MINKKILRLYLIIFITPFLVNCSNEDVIDNEQYVGNYKIISFQSNIAVDLNKDGITSEELVNEINTFDFNDLEIKPNLLSFFFPKTWITFQYPSSPEGSIEFIDYGFGTTYQYEKNSFSLNGKSYVEEAYIDNTQSNKTVMINSNLIIIDHNHLKISISKEYYDFNSNQWTLLDIDAIYGKQ
ncbi:hypothetical protein [Chondrinema litorale]|uniref:hypothetical protein n=1 Tax=Chondrinema litorale TaxID=2994555 RepID=UPI0025439B16|nr:hypothetical protein [Chondrinema litorale]UZR99604.1 hypothetical protein OQ292_37075 [Chondrinema litorale]